MERSGFDSGAFDARNEDHEKAAGRHPARSRDGVRLDMATTQEPDGSRLSSAQASGWVCGDIRQRHSPLPPLSTPGRRTGPRPPHPGSHTRSSPPRSWRPTRQTAGWHQRRLQRLALPNAPR
jgi:hypothetical protein